AASSTVTFNDAKNSLIVTARETGGTIVRDASTAALTITAGTYVGPIDPSKSSSVLTPDPTDGSTGGTQASDGRVALSYYTRIEYNALGVRIATNEDTGLWRRLGVDANGNVVK